MRERKAYRALRMALPILGTAALLSGCVSITPEQCESVNWADVGYEAGVTAEPFNLNSSFEQKCAELGVLPNEAAYRSGYDQGAADYCTPLGVFSKAVERNAPLGLCNDPTGELAELAAIGESHRVAVSRFEAAEDHLESLHSDIRGYRRKIDKRRAEITDLQAQLDDPATPDAAKPEIRHAIEKFRDKIDRNRRRIRDARENILEAESDLRVVTPLFDDSVSFVETTLRSLEREARR
jgi:hypothetical protein